MKRDSRGRFSKEKEKNGKIVVNLPSLENVIFYLLLTVILAPWIIIISKLNIWDKIKEKLEELMAITNKSNEEGAKKNGLFY